MGLLGFEKYFAAITIIGGLLLAWFVAKRLGLLQPKYNYQSYQRPRRRKKDNKLILIVVVIVAAIVIFLIL
jgi:hypothetical protein